MDGIITKEAGGTLPFELLNERQDPRFLIQFYAIKEWDAP